MKNRCLLIAFLLLAFYKSKAQQPQLILPQKPYFSQYTELLTDEKDDKLYINDWSGTQVWNLKMGKLLVPNLKERYQAVFARISTNRQKVFICYKDSIPQIWDYNKNTFICRLELKWDFIRNSFVFSPDGEKLYIQKNNLPVQIFDTRTGKRLAIFDKNPINFDRIISSPDGSRIITSVISGSSPHYATLWDAATGKWITDMPGSLITYSEQSFSSDGAKLITTAFSYEPNPVLRSGPVPAERLIADSFVRVFNVKTGQLLHKLPVHAINISSAKFSPDGKYILTYDSDKDIALWNAETGSKAIQLKQPDKPVYFATFTPDAKNILLLTDSVMRQFNIAKRTIISTVAKPAAIIYRGKFINDRELLLEQERELLVWDNKRQRAQQMIKGHISSFFSMIPLQNGLFATYPSMSTLHAPQQYGIWDVNTGSLRGKLYFIPRIADDKRSVYSRRWKIISDADSNQLPNQLYELQPDQNEKTGDADWTINPYCKNGDKQFSYQFAYLDNKSSLLFYKKLFVYHSADGSPLGYLKADSNFVFRNAVFSPDCKYILTFHTNTATLWDASSLNKVKEIAVPDKLIGRATFSPDSKYLVVQCNYNGYYAGNMTLWELPTGKQTDATSSVIFTGKFTADHKQMILMNASADSTIFRSIPEKSNSFVLEGAYAGISPDATRLATYNKKNATLIVWDIRDTPVPLLRQYDSAYFRNYFFSRDNRYMFYANDQFFVCRDTKTGKDLCTYIPVDSTDYVTTIPGGYYRSSPGGAKQLHYVTKDLNVISFRQLDIRFNRPDKILEALNNTDTVLIKSYRRAWEKRIKRLSIDTASFRSDYGMPEADFTERDKIGYEQPGDSIRLHIRATDISGTLDRYNVWVNDVPLYGQRGVNIRERRIHELDTVVTVRLSPGENQLETSVTNINGTESYRMPLHVYSNRTDKHKVYFVGIGIDRFADSIHNLRYSVKDIRDICAALKKKLGTQLIADTLFNEQLTIARLRALKDRLRQTAVNDQVIVAYSGHGLLSDSLDYFLSAYNVDFKKPSVGGIPYEELEDLLDGIPARKKLLLIDACHSGEVDKEEMLAINRKAALLGLSRGGETESTADSKHTGLEKSFELMQTLFVNAGSSTGAVVISAAAGNQYALEGVDRQPNGVFTHCLLETFGSKQPLKVSELRNYVTSRVQEITVGLQRPTCRNEPLNVDWIVW